MGLGLIARPELVFLNVPGPDGPTALRAMADRLQEAGVVADADELYRRLWEREKLGSTAIGSGVAIPHCKMPGLEEVIVAVGVAARGLDFESEEGQPVRLLFVVISPEASPAAHLQALSSISKWVKRNPRFDRLSDLDSPAAVFEALEEGSS